MLAGDRLRAPHVLAPGDHMRACHGAHLRRLRQPGERREFRNVDLVRAARFRIGDVGQPFEFRRHVGEI